MILNASAIERISKLWFELVLDAADFSLWSVNIDNHSFDSNMKGQN